MNQNNKPAEVQSIAKDKQEKNLKKNQQQLAEYEERIKKISLEKENKLNNGVTVAQKLEKAQENRTELETKQTHQTLVKIQSKQELYEKNKDKLNQEAQKAKEESVSNYFFDYC